jgi:hypothetical protein
VLLSMERERINENAANEKKKTFARSKIFSKLIWTGWNTLGFYYSLNIAFKDMDFYIFGYLSRLSMEIKERIAF